MTTHARRNEGRYRLAIHRGSKRNAPPCWSGAGSCPNPTGYYASSPSFHAKPMCAYHASQWANRHRIKVPGAPAAREEA